MGKSSRLEPPDTKKPHPLDEALFVYGAPGTMTKSAVASGALTLWARRFTTGCSLLRTEPNGYVASTESAGYKEAPSVG